MKDREDYSWLAGFLTEAEFDSVVASIEKDREACRRVASGEYGPGPIAWNPWNKVVQDHRDGAVDLEATDSERARRGLPVPWTPEIAAGEMYRSPVC